MEKLDKKNKLKSIAKILAGLGGGFSFFWLMSHPNSKIKRKFPEKSIKNLQFFPNTKITHKDKVYHFHHWFIFSLLYIPLIAMVKTFRHSRILNGLVIGSILQGLTYKDRFKMVKKTPKV
ncbi:hypothetical protein C4559_03145 [Candidatus Microgenomates bacterium]|nr:MAG: hypothetical protein C4559_03145 [Candidatus Microgenomates bacterium]